MDIYYYVMILNDHITYEKNLSNLSLADSRGNNTKTSVRHSGTASPVPCSIQSRKAAVTQCCLPPRGLGASSAGQ